MHFAKSNEIQNLIAVETFGVRVFTAERWRKLAGDNVHGSRTIKTPSRRDGGKAGFQRAGNGFYKAKVIEFA